MFEWQDGVALFVAAFAATYGLMWLVRAQVVGREAIRLVATRFAALPPEVDGDPPSCRECGALLPETAADRRTAERLVVLCAYCSSENLVGLNLVPAAGREHTQAGALEVELRARLARRRGYRITSLVSLGLLAVGALSLWLRLGR